jgi:hypothetical protein
MSNVKRVWTKNLLAGAVTLGLTTACQHKAADKATPPLESDMVNQVEISQTQAGAKSDATLHPVHFDAGVLDSLGTAKLDLMVADSHRAGPLVVYLDIPDDSYKTDRQQAVVQYLASCGVPSSKLQIESGPNPDNFHPADPDMADYVRTDTAGDISSGSSSSSASPGH